MGIYKEIKTIEKELFELLVKAFEFIEQKKYNKLKICIDAILELEKDYKSLTKQNFIKKKHIKRLLTELEKHGYKK